MGGTEWLGYPAHVLPGRLRVRLPGLRHNPARGARLLAALQPCAAIRRAAVGLETGSLLVEYDAGALGLPEIAQLLGLSPAPCRAPVSPVGHLARQTALTGAALLAVVLKRALAGPSLLSHSLGLYDVAGALTVAAGYPFLRRGMLSLAQRGRISADLLLGTAGLTLSFLRESIAGLAVIFVANLVQYVSARTAAECRSCVDSLCPADPSGQEQAQAVVGTGPAVPPPADATRWGLGVAAVALTAGLVTGDWRRSLASLIAAAPGAAARAAALPLAAGAVAAARAGVLVKEPAVIGAAGQAPIRVANGRSSGAAALRAADAVILSGDDRRAALDLLELGRRARLAARQNRALVGVLTAVGLTLAATGAVGPFGASLWHNVTDLAVLANSARLIPR